MPNAIRRIDLAGRDVTDHLQLLMRGAGYDLKTSAEKEVVRGLKEEGCYVRSTSGSNSSKDDSMRPTEEFKLPDGQVIKVSETGEATEGHDALMVSYVYSVLQLGAERHLAPEILFNPELIGSEYPGVHQLVVDSINRADLDLRKNLYSNIVLSGGTTLTKGFGDRLLYEVKKLALRDMKIKIYAPPERKYATWIGGSILAGLSTFKKVGAQKGMSHFLAVLC